ncbi:hypothetical protein KM043_013675 [Ampulex compressa]|nr:hypothetical protein KM043_013675 [Ampulex compressa]
MKCLRQEPSADRKGSYANEEREESSKCWKMIHSGFMAVFMLEALLGFILVKIVAKGLAFDAEGSGEFEADAEESLEHP